MSESALRSTARYTLIAHGLGVIAFASFAMLSPVEFATKNGPGFAGAPVTTIKFLGLAMFGIGVYETAGAIYATRSFYSTKLCLRLAYAGMIGTMFGWGESAGMIGYELFGAGAAAAAYFG